MYSVKSIDRLIKEFSTLPGIGEKSGQRLAFFISRTSKEYGKRLIEAIREVTDKTKYCSICGNITETDPCPVCRDNTRDKSVICVVEEPWDIFVFEKAGIFKGLYHVLGGAISPTKGVNPQDLNIGGLMQRVRTNRIREIILGTDPNTDGQATALYIAKLLSKRGIRVTRLGMGLPVGGDLEFADEDTLSHALNGRRAM
jgi:recombination protein RecR